MSCAIWVTVSRRPTLRPTDAGPPPAPGRFPAIAYALSASYPHSMTTDSPVSPVTELVVGDFNRILEPDSPWAQAGFQLPNGDFWQYREPGAVVLVRNGWLQVA